MSEPQPDPRDPVAEHDAMLADQAATLGLYNEAATIDNAFARILLLGPSKGGKTTSILTSAPQPLVINCDGDSALRFPATSGAHFHAIDVPRRGARQAWRTAVDKAGQAVAKGLARTVVLDTVSLLAENLLNEISLTLEGFDKWNELAAQLKSGIGKLLELQAHVFIVGHLDAKGDEIAGIMPMIPGGTKGWLPAVVDDWILLDVEPGRLPHERMFALGPQKTWSHSGRNIRRTCMVPANVPALFEELQINE